MVVHQINGGANHKILDSAMASTYNRVYAKMQISSSLCPYKYNKDYNVYTLLQKILLS